VGFGICTTCCLKNVGVDSCLSVCRCSVGTAKGFDLGEYYGDVSSRTKGERKQSIYRSLQGKIESWAADPSF
jgi:hypothetical protein